MKECSARYSPDGSYIIHKDDCEAAKVKGWPTESNPADNGTTRTGFVIMNEPEWFAPTMQLRWRFYDPAEVGVLQQAWQGSNGTVQWRDIPEVILNQAGEEV